MNELDDEQLMHLVAEGDTQAYKTLYQRYASAILGVSIRMLGDRAVAEEVAQETFWRVWKNAATFEEKRGSYAGWMFGIARNLSIDVLRKRKRMIVESFPDTYHIEETSRVFESEQNVAESAWLSMQRQQVTLALTSLPSEQKDVVEWIYFQGKSRRQIAHETGIPLGTINTRAQLALKKLKKALESEGVLEDAYK